MRTVTHQTLWRGSIRTLIGIVVLVALAWIHAPSASAAQAGDSLGPGMDATWQGQAGCGTLQADAPCADLRCATCQAPIPRPVPRAGSAPAPRWREAPAPAPEGRPVRPPRRPPKG